MDNFKDSLNHVEGFVSSCDVNIDNGTRKCLLIPLEKVTENVIGLISRESSMNVGG